LVIDPPDDKFKPTPSSSSSGSAPTFVRRNERSKRQLRKQSPNRRRDHYRFVFDIKEK